jgi:betaine reductase
MDPENQSRIKSTVDRFGADDMVVVLGAADPWALEMAALTVTEGDPSFVGPLAGVQLGLPVMHIFEDDVRAQVEPKLYEDRIGFVELAVDSEAVKAAMKKLRGEAE